MKHGRKFYARFLAISIILCMISIFGTALIDTNFGSIITKDIKITDSLGHDIGLTIYQPKSATPENPAPALSACTEVITDVKARTSSAWNWQNAASLLLPWTAMATVMPPTGKIILWMRFSL